MPVQAILMQELVHAFDIPHEFLYRKNLCPQDEKSVEIAALDISLAPFLHIFQSLGEIAEGFIGQELICYASPDNKAELHFWKRKEKNSAAEIDYLIQRGDQIIPIEVKSGHGNTLRRLHIFLDTHTKSHFGIRFSSLNYSITNKLDSRPLYAAASLAHPNQKEALKHLVCEVLR